MQGGNQDEGYTLESILAEFKGSAYVAGDKRTPPEVLSQRTDSILRELKDGGLEPDETSDAEFEALKAEDTDLDAPHFNAPKPVAEKLPIIEDNITDTERRFFEDFHFADRDVMDAEDYDGGIDDEDGYDVEDVFEEEKPRSSLFSRLFRRLEPDPDEYDGVDGDADADYGYEQRVREERFAAFDEFDDDAEDPELVSEIRRFAVRVPSIRFRTFGAAILCILMVLVIFLFSRGAKLPFGIGRSEGTVTACLLIMELIVMALGIDVLLTGLEHALKRSFSAETMAFVSCVLSVADGFVMLIGGRFENGLCFSAVSACSLCFAMSARKSYYMAMVDTLKTSVASSSPNGVISEGKSIDNRLILKKVPGAYKGFYNRVIEADVGELMYRRFGPVLLILSLIFSALASFPHGRGGDFIHTFSILTAVCAAFPAASVFVVPFRYASQQAKKTGSAIAGWGGASDIFFSDGAIISDQDLYPTGTVSLSGVKFEEGVSQRKAVVYSASLIIASGSGLSRVFEELLQERGFTAMSVQNFASYDGGGIGAVVAGERVLIGTGAFMNLMGIRVPDAQNEKNSVFTAINDALAAAFSINYVPTNSVQSALVTLLNTRTNILMAVRDFNVTPNMIYQKFKVNVEGVEYMPVETVYKLSEAAVPEGCGAAAILCRGGLAPFAEVITRGRLLKLITEFNTLISLISSGIALLMMFFICWTGAFTAASVTNVFIFMAVIQFAVWVLSQFVRK